MSFPIPNALSLIRSALLLLKEEPAVLASPEDAAYFRARKEKPIPPVLPPEPVRAALPKPAPPAPRPVSPPPAPEPAALAPPVQEIKVAESVPIKEAAPAKSVSAMRKVLEKIAPELAILDAVPDDTAAKQIANRWKTKNQAAPVSILAGGELPQHKALLHEIAVAIDVYFGPARLIEADPIEKEKQWNQFLASQGLRLVVVCDSTLWQLQNLRQFYKETPASGSRTLSDTPLFLLPDLSLYLKDPLLKRSLWKAICTKLS